MPWHLWNVRPDINMSSADWLGVFKYLSIFQKAICQPRPQPTSHPRTLNGFNSHIHENPRVMGLPNSEPVLPDPLQLTHPKGHAHVSPDITLCDWLGSKHQITNSRPWPLSELNTPKQTGRKIYYVGIQTRPARSSPVHRELQSPDMTMTMRCLNTGGRYAFCNHLFLKTTRPWRYVVVMKTDLTLMGQMFWCAVQ